MLGPALAKLVSLGSRYAFYRRWRNVIAFSGVVALCAAAAVLIDMKMYLSAGVIGVVGVAALFLFLAQFFNGRREKKEREMRRIAAEVQRAAEAQARAEKMAMAKASVAQAARTMGSKTAEAARTMGGKTADVTRTVGGMTADATKTGFAAARDGLSSWRGKGNPNG